MPVIHIIQKTIPTPSSKTVLLRVQCRHGPTFRPHFFAAFQPRASLRRLVPSPRQALRQPAIFTSTEVPPIQRVMKPPIANIYSTLRAPAPGTLTSAVVVHTYLQDASEPRILCFPPQAIRASIYPSRTPITCPRGAAHQYQSTSPSQA